MSRGETDRDNSNITATTQPEKSISTTRQRYTGQLSPSHTLASAIKLKFLLN